MESLNTNIENQTEEQKFSIWELEEMLKSGKTPPGIKEYNDLPPELPQEPSKSNLQKIKKVKLFIKCLF